MQTCPKDGSLLMPTRIDGKKVLKCMTCDYVEEGSGSALKEKVVKQEIKIVDEGSTDDQHPITEQECPKCKNNQAHYWVQQTRASDEPPTRFYKCTKCKHTWREY